MQRNAWCSCPGTDCCTVAISNQPESCNTPILMGGAVDGGGALALLCCLLDPAELFLCFVQFQSYYYTRIWGVYLNVCKNVTALARLANEQGVIIHTAILHLYLVVLQTRLWCSTYICSYCNIDCMPWLFSAFSDWIQSSAKWLNICRCNFVRQALQ